MRRGVISGCFIMFGLVLFFSLVIASHDITTSTGENSYSVDEDIVNVYNITVNNTDLLLTANITQVNITIDSSFVFDDSTNGTDAASSTFTNTSIVLSWDNDGLVMNLTTQYFWFNATAATPGDYNLTITTTNVTGSSYTTNISVEVNDTTSPVWVSAANWSSYNNQSVAIFLNATDLIGIANYTVNDTNFTINASNYLVNTSVLSVKIYYLNLTVNDTSGNEAYKIVKVTMIAVPVDDDDDDDGSPSSGGSGIYYIGSNNVKMLVSEGVSRDFNVNGAMHEFTLVELVDGVAKIKIESNISEFFLKVGESAYDDLDGDSVADINITFLSMTSSGVAKFNLVKLTESFNEGVYGGKGNITTEVVTTDTVTDEESDDDAIDKTVADQSDTSLFDDGSIFRSFWFWLVVVLTIVALVLWQWEALSKLFVKESDSKK